MPTAPVSEWSGSREEVPGAGLSCDLAEDLPAPVGLNSLILVEPWASQDRVHKRQHKPTNFLVKKDLEQVSSEYLLLQGILK